ncbi:uncharacterized protein N7496_000021 [Penicillium cataractarum]|uniref:Uncharacterized protein n=1 Tax=Penicillium cataractarum TaxID=2100454 RepID=A0A9X0B5J6_9EURO|nr:uncharacterized protein N7496_000021 [Penicillium cataractarum]KAJ5388953.1 hypothetical protein N7496_000021 [Penicillium cataractarum]
MAPSKPQGPSGTAPSYRSLTLRNIKQPPKLAQKKANSPQYYSDDSSLGFTREGGEQCLE